MNLELTPGLSWGKWKFCKLEEFLPLLPSGTFLLSPVHGFCTDHLCSKAEGDPELKRTLKPLPLPTGSALAGAYLRNISPHVALEEQHSHRETRVCLSTLSLQIILTHRWSSVKEPAALVPSACGWIRSITWSISAVLPHHTRVRCRCCHLQNLTEFIRSCGQQD